MNINNLINLLWVEKEILIKICKIKDKKIIKCPQIKFKNRFTGLGLSKCLKLLSKRNFNQLHIIQDVKVGMRFSDDYQAAE